MNSKYMIGKVDWFGGRNRQTGKFNEFGYISVESGESYFVHKNNIICSESVLKKDCLVIFRLDSKNRCQELDLLQDCSRYNEVLAALGNVGVNIAKSISKKLDKIVKREDIPLVLKHIMPLLNYVEKRDMVNRYGIDLLWQDDELRRQIDLTQRIEFYLSLDKTNRNKFILEILNDTRKSDYSYDILSGVALTDIIHDQNLRRNSTIFLFIRMFFSNTDNVTLTDILKDDFIYKLKHFDNTKEWNRMHLQQFILPLKYLYDKDIWNLIPIQAKISALLNLKKKNVVFNVEELILRITDILNNNIPDDYQKQLIIFGINVLLNKNIWSKLSPNIRFNIICNMELVQELSRDIQRHLFLIILNELRNKISGTMMKTIPSWLLATDEVIIELFGTDKDSKLSIQH